MKPIKKWNYFAWQNRVPNLSDAFFFGGNDVVCNFGGLWNF